MITTRKLITWCFLFKLSKEVPSSLNIFYRSIKIQLTPSDLLPFCFQQVLNSAQLAILRTLFKPAKMVCNQVSEIAGMSVPLFFLLINIKQLPILASWTLNEYDPFLVCAFCKLMSRAFTTVGDCTGKRQR